MKSLPTSREVLDHLLTNILEVDANEIKALPRAGVKFYKKIDSFNFTQYDNLRKEGNITITCWRDVID